MQGLQGVKGDQGIQGPKGTDGKSSYTHIAYANSADGKTGFSVSDSNRTYIGMYVDNIATDSTDPDVYAWSKIRGADGAQGTPGKAGADGKTPYLHIAYANSADGKTGFSVSDSANKLYIGQYTDYTASDSTDPAKYSWTKVKGEDAAVVSSTEPADKTKLWCDTSIEPPLIKHYNSTAGAWEIVNDQSSAIETIYQSVYAVIDQESDKVLSKVGEKTYLKDDIDSLIGEVNTKFEQTKESFELDFNQITKNLNELSSGIDSEFNEIKKYIHFVDGAIIIGIEGNPLILKMINDRISFLENGNEVAYISNRRMYINDAEILSSLVLGKFSFTPRTNGNLSFGKVR